MLFTSIVLMFCAQVNNVITLQAEGAKCFEIAGQFRQYFNPKLLLLTMECHVNLARVNNLKQQLLLTCFASHIYSLLGTPQ